ncbi:MAG: response regulator [Pseudomonadota bacterium]
MSDKKILIVDDEIDILASIKIVLEGNGYLVKTTTNGDNVINIMTNDTPDLVLLDVMLPGISGYSICWQIKNNEKLKSIPVVFITAKSNESDKLMGEQMKGDGYINKPFEKDELLSVIKSFIG